MRDGRKRRKAIALSQLFFHPRILGDIVDQVRTSVLLTALPGLANEEVVGRQQQVSEENQKEGS